MEQTEQLITVRIPDNFIPERSYIIDLLFKGYLRLGYTIEKDPNASEYTIELPGKDKLIISDFFFFGVSETEGYLDEKYIPEHVSWTKNKYITEENLPILFGKEEISLVEEKGVKTLVCKIDIFAAIFFMVTRWEEYVIKEKDSHGRFSANRSLACKESFISRPIVDEYSAMLLNMLAELYPGIPKQEKEFRFSISHDIDFIRYRFSLRELLGDIIKRGSFSEFVRRLYYSLFSNPFNTFNFLMSQSELIGHRSVFNIMSGCNHKLDYSSYINSKRGRALVNEIKNRGHGIGLHPSYLSFNNSELMKSEKITLEKITGLTINSVRQHYLRFEIPYTWRIQNQIGFKIDSSLGYADVPGFRCGTCNDFKVFDVVDRKALDIIEKPLIAMEVSYVSHNKKSPEEMLREIVQLIEKVKKYKGEFTFLWHNTSFNINNWSRYKKVYEKVISYLGSSIN